MRNLKLTIAYEGSDFCGWQIQPGQPTIQGVLADALRQLAQEDIVLHGAGRTDAGVHAWGQVANFTTHSQIPSQNLQRALNAVLPPAIRLRGVEEVALDFDARWSACAKIYGFRIYRQAVVPPHLWRYVLHCPFPLDFGAMAEAARLFEGLHDFSSFAASSGSPEVDRQRITRRSIYRSELMRSTSDSPEGLPSLWAKSADDSTASTARAQESREPQAPREAAEPAESDEWVYIVRGRSFLRQMVRRIVGTLLEVGRGRMTPQDVPRLLAQHDPARSLPAAPPQGLCLLSVEYPDAATGSHPADRFEHDRTEDHQTDD